MKKKVNPVVAGLTFLVLVAVIVFIFVARMTPRLPDGYVPSREKVKDPQVRQRIMDEYNKKWKSEGH